MQNLIILSVLLLIFSAIVIVYFFEISTGYVFFTLSILFLLTGLIETKEFLSSFFDETLMTIVTLIFISRGLEYNRLTEVFRNILLNGSKRYILFKLNVFSMIYSMFVNNAAVVSTMIGILRGRYQYQRPFLMSISFASILGGMLTLVGTSTNLIVNNLKMKSGFPTWNLFDFFIIGITPAIVGLIYLSKAPLRLFGDGDTVQKDGSSIFEVRVTPDSKLIGKSIEENGLRNLKKIFLGEVVRENGDLVSPASPAHIIQKNDRLVFVGDKEDIRSIGILEDLTILDTDPNYLLKNVNEVIVSDESDLIGLTPKNAQFRSRFNAVIISIRRGEKVFYKNIGEEIIRSGDQLTLVIGNDFTKSHSNDLSFVHLEKRTETNGMITSLLFLGFFICILTLNLFGLLSLFKGTLLVLLFAILTKIIPLNSLRSEIPYNLIMTVGSAFVISVVLKNLKAPELVLSFILPYLLQMPVFISLFLFFLFVIFLTEFVSNAVAAGIAFPFALSLAQGLSTATEPFFLITAFGASASFLTPFGYHTNMMVFSVGHYKPSDFLKLGLPLTVAYVVFVYASILYTFDLYVSF
ncbi:SLC13 family permease [Leptospira levettii]|uniref:SLC13 family permease n=1 Tax=Leptospira levettii TaxID=2023178 RepID=UPI0010840870|nr:SLC13 family permease [Leptospira levettii]MCW7509307.1 SLC13 family permease [Leptospira levettii]MCW7520396.1 SLC13 family permease [Leptospira levettii]TGK97357.1 SLC13 family permease [Leptospira levettii]